AQRALHSFPTRRSSDLVAVVVVVLLGLGGSAAAAVPEPEPEPESKPAGTDRPITRSILVSRDYRVELGPFHVSFRLPAELTAARSEEHTSELQSLAYLV